MEDWRQGVWIHTHVRLGYWEHRETERGLPQIKGIAGAESLEHPV